MKQLLKKTAAVLLAAVICFSCLPVFSSAAIPAGLERGEIRTAMNKTGELLKKLPEDKNPLSDAEGTFFSMLCSDDTLNSVFCGIYSALSENESTFSTLGADISVSGVAAALRDYPGVHDYLLNCGDWQTVLSGAMNCSWGVSGKEGFSAALGKMLSPLDDILYVLLCGGTYKVSSLVSVVGDNGYQNAIVPLLRAIGCPDIMSQSEFAAQATGNRGSMLANILNMFFDAVGNMFVSPVSSLCRYLPAVADYLVNDGLSNSVSTLIAPLKIRVLFVSFSGLDSLAEKTDMFSNSADLTNMISNIDLSEIFGSDVKINMPEISLEKLAACGRRDGGVYTADEEAAFVEILNWIITLVKNNSSVLPSLLGDTGINAEGAGDLINGILAKSNDELIKLLVDILNYEGAPFTLEYQWTYPSYTPAGIEYTPTLTRDDYVKVLEEIDGTLGEFLTEFGGGTNLSDTVACAVYSGSVVTTVVKELFSALYSDETASLFAMLGIDASVEGVAKTIEGSYPSAARSLRAAGSWNKVNPASVSWGFYAGSRSGFESALEKVLSPFADALGFLLCEQPFSVMDLFTIGGGNGYNTAVIPLLEGLGCPVDSVKTYGEYKAAAGTVKTVTYILDPVCDLLDSVIESPVASLCGLLPQLVYFMNSGVITQSVDNLLYPVKQLLKEFGMESMLPSELTSFSFDISALLKDFMSSGELASLSLPDPDLNKIASLGTAKAGPSNRTYNGLRTERTYIEADAPAVLVTVLRYVINGIKNSDTDLMSSLMGGSEGEDGGMPDMFAMYADNITEKLEVLSVDETIEWLFDLLFAETPTREILPEQDEVIPTVIYVPVKDYTKTKIIAAVSAAFLLVFGLIIFIAKFDFSENKEKKQRKKLRKKKAKEEKKLARAKTPSPEKVQLSPDIPVPEKLPETKNGAPKAVPSETPVQIKPQAGDISMAKKPPAHVHHEHAEPEFIAEIEAEKAAKKALREAKRADRFYYRNK